MYWFTTKLTVVSIILYLTPSGECLRRYHNIHKRWSFDPIVSYFDERHGGGARSFMVYQGDWWWTNPFLSILDITRITKAFTSHYAYYVPFTPLLVLPAWLIFPPYAHNKLLPYDDYYHFPMQVYAHTIDKNLRGGRVFTLKPVRVKYTKGWLPEVPMDVIDRKTTPDFRAPESVITWATRSYYPHFVGHFNQYEYHRYFRLQGCTVNDWLNAIVTGGYGTNIPMVHLAAHIKYTNCYCVLVFKKLYPIGMGAVISYKNILTTASATEMVLEKYRKRLSLINLLGLWYNSDVYNHWCWVFYRITNNSYYATPARIVYHNLWVPPRLLNRTHPLPVMHDLAIWTTTNRLLYEFGLINGLVHWVVSGLGIRAQICHRFSFAKVFLLKIIHWKAEAPNSFGLSDPFYIISCAMVLDQGRIPYPWFRYHYLTNKNDLLKICPIIKWGWFYCLRMRGPVGRVGVESGAALHVAWHSTHWWGLAGLSTISFRLRTKTVVTFFTILDTYKVLHWIFDAFHSRVPMEYLDVRFRNRPGKHLDYRAGAMGGEWDYVKDPIRAWWPLLEISAPRNAPWFWYWHYKSLPMERDFFYDVLAF